MPCTDLRVKELLKERSWTTKVLAEKTGMSESYLTHIKNGTRRWNEDSLKRIAEAFELEPISLLTGYQRKDNVKKIASEVVVQPAIAEIQKKSLLSVKKVPMVGEIPSYPSEYNNKIMQVTSGYKEMFVPVLGIDGEDFFCLVVENQSMSPRFMKGDCLIVSPTAEVISGDLVAVEYKADKTYKQVMMISFSENLIMLEFVNHKQAPIALVKNRDYCRIIGKIVSVYQKHS